MSLLGVVLEGRIWPRHMREGRKHTPDEKCHEEGDGVLLKSPLEAGSGEKTAGEIHRENRTTD